MPNTIRVIIDTSDLENLPKDINAALEQFRKSNIIGQVLAVNDIIYLSHF